MTIPRGSLLASLALAAAILPSCPESSGASQSADPPLPPQLPSYDAELADAIREAADAVRADPASVEAWMRLGSIYEAHTLHDFAVRCYAEAVALDDTDAKAVYRLAVTASHEGDVDRAVAMLTRTIALAPDYVPAHRRLARWHLDLGRLEAARTSFQAALSLDSDDAWSLLGLAQVQLEEGDAEGALAALDDARFARGAVAVLAHRVRGLALIRLGREGAERELALGRQARPGGSDPWTREATRGKVGTTANFLKARRLLERGQTEGALAILEELREKDPDDPRVQRGLARAYSLLDRWEEAATALALAVELEPEQTDVRVGWAAALVRIGDREGAALALEETLGIDAAGVEAYVALAALRLEDGELDAVCALRDRARENGVRSAELEVNAGKAELEDGRFQDARASFEHATALDGDDVDAWIGLALARAELGEKDAARDALARAEDLDRAHPMVATLREEIDG